MTVAAGFFGKISNRGDFVRHGLPSDFVTALDAWWQHVLADSRARLGDGWVDAWMEAPVWRFAFAPGICGAGAAVGLWLPSTDKAGRLFPLTIAAVAPRWRELARFGSFLEAAEEIGFDAVQQDVTPEELARAVTEAANETATSIEEPGAGMTIWWTDGAPLVRPAIRRLRGLPDATAFAAMLRDDG